LQECLIEDLSFQPYAGNLANALENSSQQANNIGSNRIISVNATVFDREDLTFFKDVIYRARPTVEQTNSL
jgi:CTP-dependent riboflavin kinase